MAIIRRCMFIYLSDTLNESSHLKSMKEGTFSGISFLNPRAYLTGVHCRIGMARL